MLLWISLLPLFRIVSLTSVKTFHGDDNLIKEEMITSSDTNKTGTSADDPHRRIGDMLFTRESWLRWTTKVKGLIPSEQSRWPKDKDGYVIIPYEISKSNVVSEANLTRAMDQWSDKTCVRFYRKDQLPAALKGFGNNWLVFQNGTGCYTWVGMENEGGQAVNLGSDCDKANVIAHEVGHALGLVHEQSRYDRDNNLVVFFGNIKTDVVNNFMKFIDNSFSVPYNYLSTMQYSWNAGSFKADKPAMLPRDPSLRYLLTNYESNPVSHYDALAINRAYKCEDTWRTKCGDAAPTCLNYGYLGKDCKCVCPDGTSGLNCGLKTAASLPLYPPSPCGGKIISPGDFTVPGTGGPRSPISCVWFVEAPTCKIAQVKVSNFSLDYDPFCQFESLRVGSKNLHIPQIGPFCGDEAVSGGITFTGSPSLALYFSSNLNYFDRATGFDFNVDFLNDPACAPKPELVKVVKPQSDKCLLKKVDDKTFVWTSPDFPEKAPSNSACNLQLTTILSGFNVSLDFFKVTGDGNCQNAYVLFAPTFPPKRLCNDKTGTVFKIDQKQSIMQYKSNPSYSSAGFSITITAM